jgi:hypothetical protein
MFDRMASFEQIKEEIPNLLNDEWIKTLGIRARPTQFNEGNSPAINGVYFVGIGDRY